MTCPTCRSPAPHLHPAVQHEGEVEPCRDPFHETVTPQNTPERIAKTQAFFHAALTLIEEHEREAYERTVVAGLA